MLIRCVTASLSLILIAAPAWAQADRDDQVWTSLNVTKSVVEDVDLLLELHSRYTNDAVRIGQVLVRPSLTWRLPGGMSVAAGYLYVRNRPVNAAANDEHRSWQQIGYTFHTGREGLAITGRTRVEQRFRPDSIGMGWRIRQQVRAQLPLPRTNIRALVWNETFVGLNDTRWGARAGVDQVRTFIGASVPLTDEIGLEPGYLNQTVFRRGPDAVNHIAAANLLVRF